MAEHPLKIFEQVDPQHLKEIQNSNAFTFQDGALPKKVKLLMAMALDASHGTSDGVKSLAGQAMQAGASRDEVMEAIRVAHYISGVGAVFTAAKAFKELFG